MSRTAHHRQYRKRDNGDLWSRRPMSGASKTAENKRMSRKIERAQSKKIVFRAISKPGDTPNI